MKLNITMIRSHQAKIWKEAFKFWNRVNIENRKSIAFNGEFYWAFGRIPELKEKQSVFSVGRVVEKKNKTK